jgi:hypothetical protein
VGTIDPPAVRTKKIDSVEDRQIDQGDTHEISSAALSPYDNFNGKIRTFQTETSTCEALACSGSRIVAAGKLEDLRRFAGPDTEMIDLKGRTAIPGLTDTHVHLSEKGTAEMELVDCRDFYVDVNSVSDILQRLANAAASAPKGSWLVAHGSPMQDFRINDHRFPDKHDLDRAVPDIRCRSRSAPMSPSAIRWRSPPLRLPGTQPIRPAAISNMIRRRRTHGRTP